MNTKYFKNVGTLEELRKQYKTLLKKHHPDCGGSEETTKEIIAEYERIFKELEKGDKYDRNDSKATEAHKTTYDAKVDAELRAAIERIIHFEGLKIEIVGYWLYVSGQTWAVKEELKSAHYWWSPSKKVWYWGGSDDFKPNGSRGHTMSRNRAKYGSEIIETEEATKKIA